MKFSDEIVTNYSRHHDLLQEADHVRLLRHAQTRPSPLGSLIQYLQKRSNRLNVSRKKTGVSTRRNTSRPHASG